MSEMKELLEDFMKTMQYVSSTNKESVAAFSRFMEAVLKNNALDTKTKELISLAIGVARCCKYCIALHVKNALEAGATKEEIIEASLVAVLMSGGPAFAYTTEVIKALEEFG